MVLTPPRPSSSSSQPTKERAARNETQTSFGQELTAEEKLRKGKIRRKYKRKRIPETERELRSMREDMQRAYEKLCRNGTPASLWSFEMLFPDPVWDEASVKRDLYEVREQDRKTQLGRSKKDKGPASAAAPKMRSSFYGGTSMMRIWREPRLSSAYLPSEANNHYATQAVENGTLESSLNVDPNELLAEIIAQGNQTIRVGAFNESIRVDQDMTRLVEDRVYGYRRTPSGDFQYDTTLMGDGAVKFREGVRLGNPLRVNADRLNYFARKELQHGKIEEAQEMYERAVNIDPRDGRAYLGLSRCAERRRDFKLARELLKTGIANSVSLDGVKADRGANPFLLQTLGCLEEKMGDLSKAEALYIAAAKSRPSHAAAWVALARLRTTKLGQSVQAGRACYQTAEDELRQAGMRRSSHVYTAWAALEYHKAGDVRRARELFNSALEVDKRCSAAFLQLGVMEADNENWEAAQECFDKVLQYDQRNSRVLQAYALMETKRPGGSSRKAIGLFERALKANPRDAGVLQPYALYVAELGDADSARKLLRRGTEVNKRDAPVWQAWGVLETRDGNPGEARKIFQQGIWACAQLTGGQSGGYHCARLWQAWGVLEARQGDHAAARRCFSRALDADSRNLPAVTAWASMEEEVANVSDARSIFERALSRFAPGSDEKNCLWRSYELMEQRLGHVEEAQKVYQRSMREALAAVDEDQGAADRREQRPKMGPKKPDLKKVLTRTADEEVEVVRWNSLGGEVWMNDRAIEGKLPGYGKKRRKQE
jgi:tetratricopeptide (TPR) repeat protein